MRNRRHLVMMQPCWLSERMQTVSFWLIEDRCDHLSARRGAELPVMVQRYGLVLNCEMISCMVT